MPKREKDYINFTTKIWRTTQIWSSKLEDVFELYDRKWQQSIKKTPKKSGFTLKVIWISMATKTHSVQLFQKLLMENLRSKKDILQILLDQIWIYTNQELERNWEKTFVNLSRAWCLQENILRWQQPCIKLTD